jgi:DUF1680 family protein
VTLKIDGREQAVDAQVALSFDPTHWRDKTEVEMTMPMAPVAVPNADDANLAAVMYGPLVLAVDSWQPTFRRS